MSKPLLSGMLGKMLEYVTDNPGVSGTDVATHFGISRDRATNYLCILKRRGLIYSRKAEPTYQWYRCEAKAVWLCVQPVENVRYY